MSNRYDLEVFDENIKIGNSIIDSNRNYTKEIYKLISNNNFNKKIFLDKLKEENRFVYSELTYFIFEEVELDNLIGNLEMVNSSEEILNTDVDTQIKFLKIYDYLTLGFIHRGTIKLLESETKKINDKIKKSQEDLKKISEEIKNYKFDIIGIISGVLSIYTIFGADYIFLSKIIEGRNIVMILLLFIFINIFLIFTLKILMYSIKLLFKDNKNNLFSLELSILKYIKDKLKK